MAHGIAVTISSKTFLKFFARLSFKKAAFPFTGVLQSATEIHYIWYSIL